ncbi:hypothetical protein [Mumia sp. DW29H23]|uniref:hypothetical protein n=1 Tax=Mumia sp. DW29H23 TaxID=3421241 RepID=UPI003D6841F7
MPRRAWDAYRDQIMQPGVAADDDVVVSHVRARFLGSFVESVARVRLDETHRALTLPFPLEQGQRAPEMRPVFVATMPLRAGPLGHDVVAAAGLPRDELRTVFGQPLTDPVAVIDLVGGPVSVIEQWWNADLPSLAVLVGADDPSAPVVAAARRLVPAAARGVVPVLLIPERVRDVVQAVVGDRGLVLPRTGSAVVAATAPDRTARTIVEFTPGRTDPRAASLAVAAGAIEVGTTVQEALAVHGTSSALAGELEDDAAPDPALLAELARERGRIAVLESDLRKARRHIRALEHQYRPTAAPPREDTGPERLVRGADPDVPHQPEASAPERDFPTFARLLEAADSELAHVVLADDLRERSAILDTYPKAGRWRRRTWAALTTLDAYAAAKADGRTRAPNLRAFVAGRPSELLNERHVATAETAYTRQNRELRELRTFPVPTAVAPEGRAFFGPHVRIQLGGGRPNPRLYFYDDTSGATGKVYVGHLGEHLRSRRG